MVSFQLLFDKLMRPRLIPSSLTMKQSLLTIFIYENEKAALD